MSFAASQPAVQRPKRLQFSNGTFYSFEKGAFRAHDTTDRMLTEAEFRSEAIDTLQDTRSMQRLTAGETEWMAVSAIDLETRDLRDREARRSITLVDPNLPPSVVKFADPKKPIGSTWMFYPKIAGYADVWPPGPCRIVEHVEPGPLKPGTPERDYVVERDGGVRLFSNDASLAVLASVPTQVAVSIEERSKLNAFVKLSASPLDERGLKAVGSEWLFDPAKAFDPTGRPVLCRVIEQFPGVLQEPSRRYRIVTSGGAHLYASDESLTSLAAPHG